MRSEGGEKEGGKKGRARIWKDIRREDRKVSC